MTLEHLRCVRCGQPELYWGIRLWPAPGEYQRKDRPQREVLRLLQRMRRNPAYSKIRGKTPAKTFAGQRFLFLWGPGPGSVRVRSLRDCENILRAQKSHYASLECLACHAAYAAPNSFPFGGGTRTVRQIMEKSRNPQETLRFLRWTGPEPGPETRHIPGICTQRSLECPFCGQPEIRIRIHRAYTLDGAVRTRKKGQPHPLDALLLDLTPEERERSGWRRRGGPGGGFNYTAFVENLGTAHKNGINERLDRRRSTAALFCRKCGHHCKVPPVPRLPKHLQPRKPWQNPARPVEQLYEELQELFRQPGPGPGPGSGSGPDPDLGPDLSPGPGTARTELLMYNPNANYASQELERLKALQNDPKYRLRHTPLSPLRENQS